MDETKNTEKQNPELAEEVTSNSVETEDKSDSGDDKSESGSKAELNELKGKIEAKDRELAELKDLMQRRQADFENYKKRCIRQEDTNKKMLIKDIALDVLEISDNLARASEAAVTIPEGKSLEDAHKSYVEGVGLISKSIEMMLAKYGITAIDSINQPFDPNVHEAVEINMSPEVDSVKVTKVYQKGFRMEDFVLRTSKVCVTRPQPSDDQKKADSADKQ